VEDIIARQENLSLKISTPLGEDILILDSLNGFEQISTPFEFHLKLHSTNATIDFSTLIGQEVVVTFSLGDTQRYFAGIVGEMLQDQTAASKDSFTTHYQMKIYPSLWLLKFNTDYRIFQNMLVIDIIKKIFAENKLTKFKDKTAKERKDLREFCVQYGESAFDFVSRLMEQEGIFYFFEHTATEHQLILADTNDAFIQQPSETIGIVKAIEGAPSFNKILFCSLHQQMIPQSTTMIDYNFAVATTVMTANAEGKGTGGMIYRYPGLFGQQDKGEFYSTVGIQALEWNQITFQGTSTAAQLTAGYKFMVKDHLRANINTTYVTYRIQHSINQHSQPLSPHEESDENSSSFYENQFVAFEFAVPFSPPIVTPKPRIYGTQTAVVTGKAGEEIWTDKYGCVTVKFYWDHAGTSDEKSSCMIRVAQMWAMSGWGTLFTPRVGQEVVVTFLEGDPDRPLITGCVYNCNNIPPYLPDTPTKSMIKTNTSKGGGGLPNELRFEDKKDAEEIFINAQKDMNRVVKNNDTLTITEGSRTIELQAAGKDTPNHSLTIIKGNNIIKLNQGNIEITLTKGDETHTITGNITLKATGSITLDATESIILKSGKDLSMNAGTTLSAQSGTGATVHGGTTLDLKSGTACAITAGTDLNLKSTAAASLEGVTVKIKGSAGVKIDGGPSLELKSAATSQITSPAGVKVTGAAIALSGAVKLG